MYLRRIFETSGHNTLLFLQISKTNVFFWWVHFFQVLLTYALSFSCYHSCIFRAFGMLLSTDLRLAIIETLEYSLNFTKFFHYLPIKFQKISRTNARINKHGPLGNFRPSMNCCCLFCNYCDIFILWVSHFFSFLSKSEEL